MNRDRREFLGGSCRMAAGAALALSPLGTLSAGGRPAPSVQEGKADRGERLVLAVIGVGGRGQALMKWALAHKGAVVSSVCDVNRRHLARAADTVRGVQGKEPGRLTDFRRVLDDRAVDAVVVATPHHWHCPIAVRAVDAGKHLYIEKPASHVFREGRLLAEAARRQKRTVQHGTQMRSSEVTREAGKVLASGILGEIKMAKAWGVEPRPHHPQPVADESAPEWLDYETWLGPAPRRPFNRLRFQRWNNYRDYGNGEIGGDGIHDIDMARWGLGVKSHPVRVTAHGSRIHLRGESDYPDNMVVTWQYAEDKVLIYENRNFAPYKTHGWDNGNIFYGTQGYMIFSRRGYFQTYLGAREEKGPGMRGGAGNLEHVHDFIDSVRDGKSNHADADAAHLSCGLVHLGEIAYRTGAGTLRFDPDREVFRDNDRANAMLTKGYRGPWALEKA